MRIRLAASALALGALFATVALAQPIQYQQSDLRNNQPVSVAKPLPVASPQSSITGSVTAATIGTSSAQVLAAASRQLLAIDNESTTATIACAFGAPAAINTAGSFTLAPGVTRVWKDYPVPADAVNCIASAASTPATVEAN